MFVRTVETRRGGKTHRYLRVVENYRYNGKVKQRVLWNLGNLDKIRQKLPRLTRSLSSHSGEELVALKKLRTESVKEYGNVLLLRSIWEKLGAEEVLGGRTAERMRPYFMALVFHHLQNPGGTLPLAEWLKRVYLPELEGSRGSGRARLNVEKRVLKLLRELGGDVRRDGRLNVMPKASRKRTVPFCYLVRLRMNVSGARRGQRGQRETLLAILSVGGEPRAYCVCEGKSPLAFVKDMIAADSVSGRRKTTLVTDRKTAGDAVTNLLNRERIPYVVFVDRLSKKGVGRPVYKSRGGYVARRTKTGGRKGPKTYVFFKKSGRSPKKEQAEFAFKTNVRGRTVLVKAVKTCRERNNFQGFFGNVSAPAGLLSRGEYRRGYVPVCMTAFLLTKTLEKGLSRTRAGRGLTPPMLLDSLKEIKLVTNEVAGRRLSRVTKTSRHTGELLRSFGVKSPRASVRLSGDSVTP
ncbi:MAG: hypothetical protein ACYSRP_00745 [Planctomycetota bacterium]|jgi:hypothetical protein